MNAADLHHRAKTACAAERAATHALAAALRDIDDQRAYRQLGYASLAEYADLELGLDARRTRELVAVARRLARMPVLAAAVERGDVGWTKAREVLRVATPETDAAWTEAAATRTSRDLEALVRAERVDADLKEPARKRLVLTLDAADAERIAVWLAAQRAATPDQVDDGALLAALCTADLERMPDADAPSGERYRVHVQRCDHCQHETCPDHELSEEAAGEAACDAEVVDLTGGPHHGRLTRAIPPRVRRAVLGAYGGCCGIPGCRNRLWVDVHHIVARALGGTHAPDNLVPLCTSHILSVKRAIPSRRREK